MQRTLLLVVVALLLGPATWPRNAAAQEASPEVVVTPSYSLGDQILAIRLGFFTPLFLVSFTPIDGQSVHPTNLGLGGTVALNWNAYLDEHFTVGLELGGSLAVDINSSALFVVSTMARGAYTINTPRMEIPISLSLGTMVMRLVDKTSVAFTLRPGVSLLWRVTSSWSFGGTLEWWLAYEPAWQDVPPEQRMLGNFLDITAAAVYHF